MKEKSTRHRRLRPDLSRLDRLELRQEARAALAWFNAWLNRFETGGEVGEAMFQTVERHHAALQEMIRRDCDNAVSDPAEILRRQADHDAEDSGWSIPGKQAAYKD